MPSYNLHELLTTYPTPLLPQDGFEPSSGHQPMTPDRLLPQLRRTDLDVAIGRFSCVVRSTFFPRIQYEERDSADRNSAIETACHFYLHPILACANGIRIPSYPEVFVDNGFHCNGGVCFEFKLGDLPFPEHSPQVPRGPLPVVVFTAPGTLNVRDWTEVSNVSNSFASQPRQVELASIAQRYAGRYVVITDTLTALAVRLVQASEGAQLCYTPFPDLQRDPLRVVVATLLDESLGYGNYFEPSPHMFERDEPSGALDRPERRRVAYEEAMQLWAQKSDIDWYTACNDKEYRNVVSRWMEEMLSTHQGKPVVSQGDVLKVNPFAYKRRHVKLHPLYAKAPLPEGTATILEDKRRDGFLEMLGDSMVGAREVEIRVLGEIDSSNPMDGASYACEVVSFDGSPSSNGPKLRVKVFDDRRMGNQERVFADHQWFFHSVLTQSDVLVGLEDAAYGRLDHAQGTVLPYYYGAHEVVLPDGVRCWAILTELVQGDNPQTLPRDTPEEIKADVVESIRHVVRVLQFSDVTKPNWRYGDIRIHFAQSGSSSGVSDRPVCTVVNLWRAQFSTLDGPPSRHDDYGELDALLSLPFGSDLVLECFGEREPWDFFAYPTNEYVGENWRPGDYDANLYALGTSEEDPRMYRAGGYHPVYPGELYDGHYRVVRKLGWGMYSTVWLARDTRSLDFVALKFLQAHRISSMDEDQALSLIAEHPLAWNHISKRLHSFTHTGPNGSHTCIVLELLAANVRDLSTGLPNQALPTDRVKRVARQLLLALECVHTQGIIHTDIKHSNLLLAIPGIERDLEIEIIKETNATHQSEHILPAYYPFVSQPLSARLSNDFVLKLVDFGSAQRVNDLSALWPIQPELLRAPEVIIDAGWGTPAEIWNFACLIYELYSGRALFGGTGYLAIAPQALQLAQMQSICGPFPKELLKRGKLSSDYFDLETGQVGPVNISPMPLKGFVEGWMTALHGASEAEIEQFEDFLKIMLRLEPESRPSVSDLLRHPWLSS